MTSPPRVARSGHRPPGSSPRNAPLDGRGTERGQASLLILGFFLVAVMLVGVVVDASAAYLRRQTLDGLADGAALAAANGVQGEQVYVSGLGETAQIDPVAAREYVATYLTQSHAYQRFHGLQYQVTPAGDAVSVHLSAPLDLPVPPPGWGADPWIDGIASASVPVG